MWCDAGGVICSLDLSLVGCKSNVNCHKLSSPPSSPEIGFLVIPSQGEEIRLPDQQQLRCYIFNSIRWVRWILRKCSAMRTRWVNMQCNHQCVICVIVLNHLGTLSEIISGDQCKRFQILFLSWMFCHPGPGWTDQLWRVPDNDQPTKGVKIELLQIDPKSPLQPPEPPKPTLADLASVNPRTQQLPQTLSVLIVIILVWQWIVHLGHLYTFMQCVHSVLWPWGEICWISTLDGFGISCLP